MEHEGNSCGDGDGHTPYLDEGLVAEVVCSSIRTLRGALKICYFSVYKLYLKRENNYRQILNSS